MKKIKERKTLKFLLIAGIIFSALIMFNTKNYAASDVPSLSVKYNGNEQIRNKTLNLSMEYKDKGVKWDIKSNTSWEVFSKDNNVISVKPCKSKDGRTGYIIITPLSYTKNGGQATIRISTVDHRINYNYYIQVTQSKLNDVPLLSVKYNGREQVRNTTLNLPIKYMNNPIQWDIESNTSWEVFSKDNNVISVKPCKSKDGRTGYIIIKPLSYTKNGGQATIRISTVDHRINYNYYIQVTGLSVQYNKKDVAQGVYLPLSMKYAKSHIDWVVNAHTGWRYECKNPNVIEVKNGQSKNTISIKPKSCIANNGKAQIRIYTVDKKYDYTYNIQVKTDSTLSVKYNRQEVEKFKASTLTMGKSVNWSVKSTSANWKVYSKDTSVIAIGIHRQPDNSGYITITPKSYTYNCGQATILIYTSNNEIINTYRIQVKADPNAPPSHTAPKNLIIRPEAEVDYTYKSKTNNTPKPTVFIKKDTSQYWTVGSKVGGVGEWKVSSPNTGIIQVVRGKMKNTNINANNLTIKALKQRRNNYSFHR